MKGLIFANFITYMQQAYGDDIATQTLKRAGKLTADGGYIEVESYPYEDMFELAGNLAALTGVTITKTFEDFGEYLFENLARRFSGFFSPDETLFGFLQKLESHIHVEVRKKFPGANMPGFEFDQIDDANLHMIYSSERAMSDFGMGMIKGAANWFKRDVFVGKKDITPNHDGTRVEIIVRLLDV
jgi:hypothetical protein